VIILKKLKIGTKVIKSILLDKIGVRTPIKVAQETNFRCNLSCKYCGIYKVRKKEMNISEIKKAMEDFSDMGTVLWGISGGEPLLRKDIGEIINYGKDVGFIIDVVTNGTLIKNKINEIKNLDMLIVSIDGPEKIHDSIRGKDVFKKALEGIKIAKENNINVTIQSVLSNENLKNNGEGLKQIANIAKELNCKFIAQSIYHDPYNNRKYMENLEFKREDYLNGLNIIKDLKKQDPNLIMISESELKWYEGFGNKNKKWNCFAGKLFCRLLPDGVIAPCLFRENDGINGLKMGFKEAFLSLPEYPGCLCWNSCFTKYNCLFSLKLDTIMNTIKAL
jgi:MoaA/NifB/PqqE/SkfB family radical SAM enzyme